LIPYNASLFFWYNIFEDVIEFTCFICSTSLE
jgi:hypothetical protein